MVRLHARAALNRHLGVLAPSAERWIQLAEHQLAEHQLAELQLTELQLASTQDASFPARTLNRWLVSIITPINAARRLLNVYSFQI